MLYHNDIFVDERRQNERSLRHILVNDKTLSFSGYCIESPKNYLSYIIDFNISLFKFWRLELLSLKTFSSAFESTTRMYSLNWV